MSIANYAPSSHWDKRFADWHRNGEDLDWGTQWIDAFLAPLTNAHASTVLDLGCGSGNDVIRLSQAGFDVIGLDYSRVAIAHAAKKAGSNIRFVVGDIAQGLPFSNDTFSAVMSNVAAHMFSDAVTRSLFGHVYRIVEEGGLSYFT